MIDLRPSVLRGADPQSPSNIVITGVSLFSCTLFSTRDFSKREIATREKADKDKIQVPINRRHDMRRKGYCFRLEVYCKGLIFMFLFIKISS